MKKLKDLIAIPERVHRGDFVLSLSKGVADAHETIRNYVVTREIAGCFDQALGLIRSAVDETASKAAYLHGSFGAGKSHFMAVLDLLLAGNVEARSIPELSAAVARIAEWADGRRFLMVPYHMVGARDIESAILGQYADYVRSVHPEVRPPGFYLATALFADAERFRQRLGDADFFAQLNAGSSGAGNGWGELDAGQWDAANFEAAMLEPPSGAERQKLVGDLITQFFRSYSTVARGSEEAFLPLDDGLAIMSQHARSLRYDAVVLFLDEMILWLAGQAADPAFVSREGSKLVKLVEAQRADRPVPLVSFIARQRDLRELVGETLAGAASVQIHDVLRHDQSRFGVIRLEDRNLPVIANKRILKPVSETARQTLAAAFEETRRFRSDVLDTLLTATGEEPMFRLVYPFSPALVQVLIAVSSALQRERTALKLMLQLLVDRRDDLELGEIIPVGDLWDVIEENNEPFSDSLRYQFEQARKLWRQRLLPMLERHHGVSWEEARRAPADPGTPSANLRNDARIHKTLLLAALVPEVEPMRALTAARLAALNHGTVRSPIPGHEAQTLLTKLKGWAGEIGEIKIGEEQNPAISIQITGVDTEPILAEARTFDNEGNRRRKIRETLYSMLGVTGGDQLLTEHEQVWRGTRRKVNLVLDNVREMTEDRLRSQRGTWTVILDFPFDDPHFGPRDDIAKLDQVQGPAETIAWIPSFLSALAARDLGTLVVLDHLLSGDRLADFTRQMNAVEREQARTLLRNQQSALQQRLRSALEVAYGIADQPADAVAAPKLEPDEHLKSLVSAFDPHMPVGADLNEALKKLLDGLFAYLYPAHPEFDTKDEVKLVALRRVLPVVQAAVAASDGRYRVTDRATQVLVRSIANPLQLGTMGETHFRLEPQWREHFDRQRAMVVSGEAVTVKMLRGWTDLPLRRGLTREVQNLLILVYAEQANLSFLLNGGVVQPSLDDIRDELILRDEALPPEAEWTEAVRRAQALFGLIPAELRNASNLGRLVDQLRGTARTKKPVVDGFCRDLARHLESFDVAGEPDRLRTTRSVQNLVSALTAAESAVVFVSALAGAKLETSETAVGQTIAKAEELSEALRTASWDMIDGLRKLTDERETAAAAILRRVAEILAADEHAIGLRAALADASRDALKLLTDFPRGPRSPEPQPPALPPTPGTVMVDDGQGQALAANEAEAALAKLTRRLRDDPSLRMDLSWRLTRSGDA